MGLLENNRCLAHVMSVLNTMRKNGEFCDLVFVLNNCKFSAHQLVMAAWSLPMKNLLQHQSACSQHLCVEYGKLDVFHMFITFMYTGDLPVQVSDISELLLLGATFQIPLLMELCEEQLKHNTDVENVIEICCLSIKFKLPDLEQHCIQFLCWHLQEITQKQTFHDLTPAQMNAVLGSEQLLKCDPEMKLCLISLWLAKDTLNREQFLALLLRHIEWSKMPENCLKEIIHTGNIFASNPSSLYLLLQSAYSSNFPLGSHKRRFQSLQKQYSCHLNSISNNSDILNLFRPKYLQLLKFSLLSPSSGDPSFPECVRNSTNTVGIKNDLGQFVNLDRNETLIYHSSECSDVDQNCINATQDVPNSADNTSKYIGVNKTSSETVCSLDTAVSSEGAHVADTQSTDVNNRTRRQILKPQRFIKDSGMTKSTSLKLSLNKTDKSGSIQQCRRGTPKDQKVKQKRMITKASSKTAKTARKRNTKPGQGSTSAKVSPVTGVAIENGIPLSLLVIFCVKISVTATKSCSGDQTSCCSLENRFIHNFDVVTPGGINIQQSFI